MSSTPILKDAKPFLKWAGGKQQLLAQYEPYFPAHFHRYFETFVGAGAIFFHLWNTGRLPSGAHLLDNNEELINVYKVVRDRLEELIAALVIHRERHCKAYYYEIRNLDRRGVILSSPCRGQHVPRQGTPLCHAERVNSSIPVAASVQRSISSWEFPGSDVQRAARTLYLNKTCYNGLYRVNSRGQFNVPLGSYKAPKIFEEDVLRAASVALQDVTLAVSDFRSVVTLAQAGDFFYFDPPYDPVSKTASFTSYTAGSFRDQDQRDLADLFTQLTERGCLCMLSNSHTPFVRELYRRFRIEIVQANRAINSKADGRGAIEEVVVLNY